MDWCGAFAMRFIHTVAAALPLCKQCIKHKTACLIFEACGYTPSECVLYMAVQHDTHLHASFNEGALGGPGKYCCLVWCK